jgi:hypothetical protein
VHQIALSHISELTDEEEGAPADDEEVDVYEEEYGEDLGDDNGHKGEQARAMAGDGYEDGEYRNDEEHWVLTEDEDIGPGTKGKMPTSQVKTKKGNTSQKKAKSTEIEIESESDDDSACDCDYLQ